MPGTILKFEEGEPLEPGVDINGDDNRNVIFWVKEAAPGGAVLVNNERTEISGALAVTFPTYFDDHTIVEADMVFNGVTIVGSLTPTRFEGYCRGSGAARVRAFHRTATFATRCSNHVFENRSRGERLGWVDAGRSRRSPVALRGGTRVDSFGALSGKVTMSGKAFSELLLSRRMNTATSCNRP